MNARGVAGVIAVGTVAAVVGLGGYTLFESKEVAKGRMLFAYYCSDCHGFTGEGDGFNSPKLEPRPRDLTDKEEKIMAKMSNEEIFEVISRDMMSFEEFEEKFGDEVEKPFIPPTMPTFKNTLSEVERWAIVAFVRTLHESSAPKVEISEQASRERPKFPPVPRPTSAASPEAADGLAQRGKALYEEKYGCVACHAINGEGGEVGLELDRAGARLRASWVYRWIKYPQAMKPETKMPNLGVSDDDALAITAYLGTLRAEPPSDEPAAVPKKAAAE